MRRVLCEGCWGQTALCPPLTRSITAASRSAWFFPRRAASPRRTCARAALPCTLRSQCSPGLLPHFKSLPSVTTLEMTPPPSKIASRTALNPLPPLSYATHVHPCLLENAHSARTRTLFTIIFSRRKQGRSGICASVPSEQMTDGCPSSMVTQCNV